MANPSPGATTSPSTYSPSAWPCLLPNLFFLPLNCGMWARRQFYSITMISLSILLFLSACGGQAQPQTPPPNTTVTQSQRDVTYPGVDSVTLAGTLVIPAHQKGTRVPGVIIVAGSGPTDKKGNQTR